MPENRFEKQVQEQMEELHFRPSAGVWEKVEEELRKKKKRRVVFYFFLLAGLGLLSYTGYNIYDHSTTSIAEQTKNSPVDANKSPNLPVSGSSTADLPTAQSSTKALENRDAILKEQRVSIPVQKTAGVPEKQASAATQRIRPLPQGGKEKVNDIDLVSLDKNKRARVKSTSEQTDGLESDPQVIRSAMELDSDTTIISTDDTKDLVRNTKPVVIETPQVETVNDSGSNKQDSAVAAILPEPNDKPAIEVGRNKKSGLRWAIEFSVGASRRNDVAIPDIFDRNNSMEVYPPLSNGGPFGPPPGVPPPVIQPPSRVKVGPAFSIGIAAEKKLTKKSSVTVGLRYAFQSDRIKTGLYRDTSLRFYNAAAQSVTVNAVYVGIQQKSLTNHYHFIQLPINYQLQLNKGNKLPITWQVGGSIGYLFSTNGLMYDTTLRGIYYKDSKAFAKFHVNLGTGFAFHFGQKKRVQWSIGPEISMDMSKLAKKAYDPKQYLLFGGINAKIFLPQKKK